MEATEAPDYQDRSVEIFLGLCGGRSGDSAGPEKESSIPLGRHIFPPGVLDDGKVLVQGNPETIESYKALRNSLRGEINEGSWEKKK